jgi:hypothetical protein
MRTAYAHQFAKPCDGDRGVFFFGPGNLTVCLRATAFSYSDFFRIWFSRESCPQKRSSSAILA